MQTLRHTALPKGHREVVIRGGTRLCAKVVRQIAAPPRWSAAGATARPAAHNPRRQQTPRRFSHRCYAEATSTDKLITENEIPAFIPRDDLMDQLYRWAIIEAAEGGVRNFGLPMNVEPFYSEEVLWGFNVSFVKEGEKQADLALRFDDDFITKYEWVDRGEDGMPVMGGREFKIKGKKFQIWKLGDTPVDEPTRAAIRNFCTALAAAMNQYYAFGSVFAQEL